MGSEMCIRDSVTAPKLPNDKSVDPAVTELKANVVSVPLPAGISELSNEKPSTVAPPTDTVKPASPAAPPEAPVNTKPVTSNWKPATGPPKSYVTSKLPEASNAPKPKLAERTTSVLIHGTSLEVSSYSPLPSGIVKVTLFRHAELLSIEE